MDTTNRIKIIREILKDIEKDIEDKNLIGEMLKHKFSADTLKENQLTFGQKAADKVASFAGSWKFIFIFIGFLIIWMVINLILSVFAFDPFPFILLNLLLSTLAAIQAPLIMMSQNRQEEKDRKRSESDYNINLKTEVIIEELYYKLEKISYSQKQLMAEIKDIKERTTN